MLTNRIARYRLDVLGEFRRRRENATIWLAQRLLRTELAYWIVVLACCRATPDDKSPDEINVLQLLKALR
jgi:hypothetical protein